MKETGHAVLITGGATGIGLRLPRNFTGLATGSLSWDGAIGGAAGVWASRKLAARRALLQRVFAIFVLLVAAYVAYRSIADP